jgi:cytochrome b561
MLTPPPSRYNNVTITLHWVMALGFVLMLGSGVAMEYIELGKSLKFKLFQWHKSGGVLLLIAGIVRLCWRQISRIPALPASITGLERRAAHAGHAMLYILMLAMPLSGWVMVSASVFGLPTIVFGWFEWPHIPWIAQGKAVSELAGRAHFYLAIAFALTIAVHIAAVIKHARYDGLNLLPRMWWTTRLPADAEETSL